MLKGNEVLTYPIISSIIIIIVLRYFHILVLHDNYEWFATVFILWFVTMMTVIMVSAHTIKPDK